MRKLETNRLILRPFTREDLDDLHAYCKLPDVGPRAGWPPHETPECSQKILEEFIRGGEVFAIVWKENGKVVGSLGIHRETAPEITPIPQRENREIGYALHPDYWGRGIMTEAVSRVLPYCFGELEVDALWVNCFTDNPKSQRVIEKCGFHEQFKGLRTLPQMGNKQMPAYYYRMMREEFLHERIPVSGRLRGI